MMGRHGRPLWWMVALSLKRVWSIVARLAVVGRALWATQCRGVHRRCRVGTLLHNGTWMDGCRAPRTMRLVPTCRRKDLGGGVVHGHGTHGKIRQGVATMKIGCMCPAETVRRIGRVILGINGMRRRWLRGEMAKDDVGDNLKVTMRDYLNVKRLLLIKMIFPEVTCRPAGWLQCMRRWKRMKRRRTLERSLARILQSSEPNKERTIETGRGLWSFGWRVRGLTFPRAWWAPELWSNWGTELLNLSSILNQKM